MLTKHSAILLLFLMTVFSPSTVLFSQNDSLATGVLKVRRPMVPSQYRVDISYSYRPAKQNFAVHLFKPKSNRNFPANNSEYLSPPEPVSLPRRVEDTTRALQDSSFMIRFYEKENRPANEFGWIEYLDQYEHYFQWNDTAGIDSACFVYSVNTKGQISVNAEGDNFKDSSSTRMKEMLLPIMKRLWIWYPAVWTVGDRRKQKKVNCFVTVKVYAVREDKLQRMPLKVVD